MKPFQGGICVILLNSPEFPNNKSILLLLECRSNLRFGINFSTLGAFWGTPAVLGHGSCCSTWSTKCSPPTHILKTTETEPNQNTNESALLYFTVLCHTVSMSCAQSKAIAQPQPQPKQMMATTTPTLLKPIRLCVTQAACCS